MRNILSLLVLFVPFMSFGQNAPGAVEQRITVELASMVPTKPVKLFELLPVGPDTDPLWRAACTQASVLRYDREAARALLSAGALVTSLEIPGLEGSRIVDLERVRITAAEFVVRTSSGRMAQAPLGAHYRGVVRGQPGSLVALSVFENEVMAIIGEGDGDLVLGLLSNDLQNRHVLYHERDLRGSPNALCGTPDLPVVGEALEDRSPQSAERTIRCVHLYWEGAYDLFQNKGSVVNVTTYLTGLFNQMATIYANDGINVLLQEIFVWDTPSPYNGTSSSSRLSQFGSTRTSFNGELAHLIDLGPYGGVAWLNALCAGTSTRMAYSGINTTFQNVPTYSWSVEVVTHETGHNLGSPHTHNCSWNGNNTAIDGCGPAAGYTEGSCPTAPVPSSAVGGTIMSYCHLVSAGIRFQNGFGPQPAQRIRDRVNVASCLLACGTSCDAPPLGVSSLTPTSVTLTWGNMGVVSYDLRWKPTASGTWTTVTGLTATTYPLSGLIQQTAYEFQVRSNCASSTSAYSASYPFTTPAPCPDALEPNNSTATAASLVLPATVNALIASATDADHYSVVLSSAGTLNIYLGSLPLDYDVRLLNSAGTQVASSANGGTAAENIAYTATAGTYYIHVFGFNNVFDIYRCYYLYISFSQACPIPIGLGTSNVLYNSATLNWTAMSGVSTYTVQWKPSASGTWTTVTGVATNSYPLSGLSQLTSYDFKVLSVCGGVQGGGGSSEYSQQFTFTTPQAPCDVVPRTVVAGRVFLDGAYRIADGLMVDSLRKLNLLPLTEPYTAMGFTVSGPLTTTAGVLATTGNNAPVDWVLVELRLNSSPYSVLESRVGLVQRDGDITAPDGTSPLGFCQNAGSYRIAVRHRNHLGAMTGSGFVLGSTATTVDLTLSATSTFGTNARKTIGSSMALWAGNVYWNNDLKYTGQDNDRDPILSAIGGSVPTGTIISYSVSDVNMDGTVKYTGQDNDRDPILSNIGGSVPTNMLIEQLP